MLLRTVTLGQDLNRLKKNTNLPVKVSIESKRRCLLKSKQMSVFLYTFCPAKYFLDIELGTTLFSDHYF
jgi:hypothetical protein